MTRHLKVYYRLHNISLVVRTLILISTVHCLISYSITMNLIVFRTSMPRSSKLCPIWRLPHHIPVCTFIPNAPHSQSISSSVVSPSLYVARSNNHEVLRYTVFTTLLLLRGTAVAQWLRCCARNRKVSGSIRDGVSGFFIDIKSFRSHNGHRIDSASNRNEYQENFLRVKTAGV